MNKLSERKKIIMNFNLRGGEEKYEGIAEDVVEIILSKSHLHDKHITKAVETLMALNLNISNAKFYNSLRPYYEANYDLIPALGIDGLLNQAVKDRVTNVIMDADIISWVNKALAFDFVNKSMKEGEIYHDALAVYIDCIKIEQYETIAEMFKDIEKIMKVFRMETITLEEVLSTDILFKIGERYF